MGFVQDAARETFRRTLKEIRAGQDMAESELRPRFDPKSHREYLKEQAGDVKSKAFHQALKYHGFRWWPANTLPPADGRPHSEGMWVNKKLGAFYPSDIVTLFREGPQAFDRWCREQKLIASKKVPKPELRKILAAR